MLIRIARQLCVLAFLSLGTVAVAAGDVPTSEQSEASECNGVGSAQECIQELTDWCFYNISRNRDQCFRSSSRYCPSTTYSTCVAQSADYCYHNTSLNREDCFSAALGTCRGNPISIHQLMEQVRQGARLVERGVDIQSTKSVERRKD